jgi:hypothetical protein
LLDEILEGPTAVMRHVDENLEGSVEFFSLQFVLYSFQIGFVFFFSVLGGGEREAGAFVHSCKFQLSSVG